MFFAALAHQYSYPHRPFHRNTPDGNSGITYNALREMWDVSDIREDIFEHISVVCGSLSRRILGRGTPAETNHLIPSGSGSSGYHNEYKPNNRPKSYGTVSTSGYEHNDGINIVKQTVAKDYSPQFGAPKTTSYFQPASSSSSSTRNDKSISENTTTNTSRSETFIEIPSGMKKSDSTASDFGLNTPIDECGINVRGMEKDSYILKYPNV